MTTDLSTKKGSILVIDDDPLLIKTLKAALENSNYEVETAENGHVGIDKAKNGHYDLVLCDIRMPGLDGIMTIQRIQQIQGKAGKDHSGFIIVSAYHSDETRKQAQHLGVTDFVSKPFDLQPFLDIVAHNIKPPKHEPTPQEKMAQINEELDEMLENLHRNQQE